MALGLQRAGSWWETGDQRGGSRLRLQSSSGRGPVDRLAFPGMRVVRRYGQLPAGFPIVAHGLQLTCEQCSGISMDLASTHSRDNTQHRPVEHSDSPAVGARLLSPSLLSFPVCLMLCVCLCKITEERVISELSKIPLGTFQENKPIFHLSHKWLPPPSHSFKTGFLRLWSTGFLHKTCPKSL